MKKHILLILLSVFSLGSIHAEIAWNLSDDGTLTISGTNMPEYSSYNIPWLYDRDRIKTVIIENKVTNIGKNAFRECPNLTSITIPNSVTNIGDYAFFYSTGLISITMSNSVKHIGTSAFYYCSSLTSINIPETVTDIGSDAFYGCSGLTSITIPHSVIDIGERAFASCSGLTSITVENGNTYYDSRENCNAIIETKSNTLITGCNNTVIPNSVTSIGERAFSECSGRTSITIPKSVKSIGKNAFLGCFGLTSMSVEKGNTRYDSRENCNAIIDKNSNTLISGCKNTVIPNSVTSIGEGAFAVCSSLTSITIPNSVKSIEVDAFISCSGLTSIIIPNSVTKIGVCAFQNCSGLISVTIPNSVTNIEDAAFWDCTGLKEFIMTGEILPKYTNDNFASGLYETTTLYVPSSLYEEYRSTSPWSKFSNIMTLEQRDEVNKVASDAVIAKINAIGKVEYTDVCKGKIDDANTAYAALTDDQKALVTNLDVLTTAKQTYDALKIAAAEKLAADKAKADPVIAKINAIGKVEYTEACKSKIDDANTAYNALTADQKNLVTNLDVLTTAQQTYDNLKAAAEKLAADNAKADPVIAKINAIGKVEYTDACKNKIDEANNVYNALTVDQKALVSNLDVLTNAQQTYDNLKAAADKLAADKAKADVVIAKITAIGNVEYTETCKDKIDAASSAYNALTDDQKALVTNLDVLTTAKQTYDNLKAAAEKLAADKAKAEPVIAKINAIGKVEYTDACKNKIDEANNAYNALTTDQKALVTNLGVLTTAQQTYDNLKAAAEKLAADKAKADAVIAKISAIGKVEYTDACKGKIDEANKVYNALTADQKALVTNLDVLNKAQQTYESLKAAAEKLAADKVAFDKYKSEQKDIIEALIKEDDSDAVKDIIKKAISDIDALGYEEAISLDDNKVNINSFVTSVNEAVEKQRAEDQKTTSIDELGFAEKVNIYDLNGRKITNSMLKSGLYIRNGKKMVVK